MKKTLCVLLTLSLAVALVFSLTFVLSAAEEKVPTATTVEVTVGETVTYLGYQPVREDGEEDGKIIDYTDANPVNEMTAGSGKLVMDPATGTLTMNNATGVNKIQVRNGNLNVVVTGTNEVTGGDAGNVFWSYSALGNVMTVSGNGTLNVSGKNYVFGSQEGEVVLSGSVTVKATSTAADAVHISNNGATDAHGWLRLKDNAVLDATGTENTVRVSSVDGGIEIGGNAKLTVKATAVSGWNAAVKTSGFKMTGGELNIDADGSGNISGLNVQNSGLKEGKVVANGALADSIFQLNGGKVNVKSHTTGDRAYGIFVKGVVKVTVGGTANVTLNVSSDKAGAGSGAISMQKGDHAADATDYLFNLTGNAVVNVTANNNVQGGAISPAVAGMKVLLDGGTVKGSATNLIRCGASGVIVDYVGGKIDFTATTSIIDANGTPVITVGDKVTVAEGGFTLTDKTLKAEGPANNTAPVDPDNGDTADSLLFAACALTVLSVATAAVVLVKKKAHN